MTKIKSHIFSLFPEEIQQQLVIWKEKPFRLKQFYNWIFANQILNPDEMKNIPESLREKFAEQYSFFLPTIIRTANSKDGSIKYVLELEDKHKIEMVFMPNEKKQTLCISTQVGCGRDCLFCATGKMGLKRNLTTAEIVSQIYLAQSLHDSVTNIVFMGMGEPLDNRENVLQSLRILQHQQLFSFSPRRITISTSGVVPGIYFLADSSIKLKLAVSLNAVTDEKRSKLMPINKQFPLAELKKALYYFAKHNPFRITLEYVMIKNFNMADNDVKQLIAFAGDLPCKINLIAWNPVAESPFQAPDKEEIEAFQQKLYKSNSAVLLRTSRGGDINAACGQLAGS